MKKPLGQNKVESMRFEAASFTYGAGSAVLENVTVDLPMRSFRHVTGPTGHGQSTLLKLLAFIVQPTAGSMFVNGLNATEMSFEEFLPLRLEIGYSFEVGGLLANKSLLDNLMLPHLYHNLSEPDAVTAEIQAMAKRFKFDKVLDRRPASVSSGLRKLVAALRPILLQPSFLVMDDPFAGLDPDTAHELERLILEKREQGEIETLYFTSRDEMWSGRLGADDLWIENGSIRTEAAKAA